MHVGFLVSLKQGPCSFLVSMPSTSWSQTQLYLGASVILWEGVKFNFRGWKYQWQSAKEIYSSDPFNLHPNSYCSKYIYPAYIHILIAFISFLINVGWTVADKVSAAPHNRQLSSCSPVRPGTQSGLQGTGLLHDNRAWKELALELLLKLWGISVK